MKQLTEQEQQKKRAAEVAVKQVKSGMTIGLGTGSTVTYFVKALNKLVNEKHLKIRCVTTSSATYDLATRLGLNLVGLEEINKIDLTVDGADEVNKNLDGIKGGKGALLFEKIVGNNSNKNIWIVDETKYKKKLGKAKLPLEILKFGHKQIFVKLKKQGYHPNFRFDATGNKFVTDSSNYIIDIIIPSKVKLTTLNKKLSNYPEVVGTGFFKDICDELIIGKKDQALIVKRKKEVS